MCKQFSFIRSYVPSSLHQKNVLWILFVFFIIGCKDVNNNLDIDEYAVTASSILSIYGLREGKDLDYIHTKSSPVLNLGEDIQSHNSYGIGMYDINYDDIIHNPENHFYSRGVKFVSPKIIKSLKEKRNEPKDINDINLLNTIL